MTSDWHELSVLAFELTDVDPHAATLFAGTVATEHLTQNHVVQVDYRVPVRLSWWRRAWLWLLRRPAPTHPATVVFPNATVTTTDPGTAGQP